VTGVQTCALPISLNMLGVVYDVADTFAVRTPYLLHDIAIEDEDDLKVQDVNGDGQPDIIVHNLLTESIEVYIRRNNGFAGPVGALHLPGCKNFVLGPVVQSGGVDLVVTNAARGTVLVVAHPWGGLR
jgi:hypothetical protein